MYQFGQDGKYSINTNMGNKESKVNTITLFNKPTCNSSSELTIQSELFH